MTDLLVVGYGNDLRRDDGLGRRVADAVAAEGWPGVEGLAVHALGPELADDLAEARWVVFVDASCDGSWGLERLEPGEAPAGSHLASPRGLLDLCGVLHGRRPEAWLLRLPGEDFGVGEGLSRAGRAALARGLTLLRGLAGGPVPRGAEAPEP